MRSKDLALRLLARRVLKAKQQALDALIAKQAESGGGAGGAASGMAALVPAAVAMPKKPKRKRPTLEPEEVMRRCAAVVLFCGSQPETNLFHLPIDAELAPIYKKVVKEPMDLRTIHRRVLSGYYTKTAAQLKRSKNRDGPYKPPAPHELFARDMNLVGTNAKTFNREGKGLSLSWRWDGWSKVARC